MANDNPSCAAADADVTPSSPTSEEGLQLQFPTIDLATSLSTTLCPSSNASTIMPSINGPIEALDESWASLDTSDYVHGEDLQSEHTDAESLVDLSSNQDTDSRADDDEERDGEEVEGYLRGDTAVDHVSPSPHGLHQQNIQYEDVTDETIILQPSREQQSSTWSQLEYTCDLPAVSMASTVLKDTVEKQMLQMAVSKEHLKPMSKPFHIAYYGVGSARVSRDELLGKIGAALVASAPTSTTSKCYNIFPTEFGPGSTPAFAELIPSQAQMVVDDITVLKHGPDRPNTIRFALKQGIIIESNTAVPAAGTGKTVWRPNLVVVHLCRDDLADDFYTAKQVIELAERHYWPFIVVSQDSAPGMYPACTSGLNKEFTVETADNVEVFEDPVDLDTFLRISTDQLNKHIRFVVDAAKARSQLSKSPSKIIDRVKVLARRTYELLNGSNAQSNGYVLEVVEASADSKDKQAIQDVCKAKILEIYRNTSYRRSLHDLLASLAITALVFMVLFACGKSSLTSFSLFRPSSAASVSQSVNSVTTVTATSAISTYVQTSTTAGHEHAATNGLDNMLQRLMGKTEDTEIPRTVNVVQDQPGKASTSAIAVRSSGRTVYDSISSTFDGLLSKIMVELNAVQKRWNETSVQRRVRREIGRKYRQQQVQEFRIRFQQLSDELSEKSRELQAKSLDTLSRVWVMPREKFIELVNRSQRAINISRRRRATKMDKVVEDHKALLRRAKRQAEQLTGKAKHRGIGQRSTEDTGKAKPRKTKGKFIPFV